jgi:hypothetical protein
VAKVPRADGKRALRLPALQGRFCENKPMRIVAFFMEFPHFDFFLFYCNEARVTIISGTCAAQASLS